MSWLAVIGQICLTIAVLTSTAFTAILLTLPKPYGHYHPRQLKEEDFTDEDKKRPDNSGYGYYQAKKDEKGLLKTTCSVQVVVLGDIGRSPRMQYHALSIASHGGQVDLIGYQDSELHPDVEASRMINVTSLAPYPKQLQTTSKAMFPIIGPLKVLWQMWSLYHALGYRTKASKWMLVQNPPSIPTLMVAQMICFFRNSKLVIDWHNFGYTILNLRLGSNHPFMMFSRWFEGFFGRGATADFAVTDAMARALGRKWGIRAIPLHDRPSKHFQPLSPEQRSSFLYRCPETAQHAEDVEKKKLRLLVSSTSWTADEDFSLLLDALVGYSSSSEQDHSLPDLLAVITGKGPLKEYYLSKIRKLQHEKKLRHAIVKTAWLSTEDYASLLGSADLGISLHTSSSGVDLPMKVVDMFGTGLPVAGWSKFEAWPELVKDGKNGVGFESADQLCEIFMTLFGGSGVKLEGLRQGALKECERRWDDEWMPVAGKLFRLEA